MTIAILTPALIVMLHDRKIHTGHSVKHLATGNPGVNNFTQS